MRKIRYRPLSLALACLLAPYHYAHASDIPLDIIQEPFNADGSQYGYRLGINVGVNGAAPQEYLFDTGSDSFNIDVGLTALHGQGPSWFPTQSGASTGPLQFYLYGDGTYGYLQAATTVGSMQFYNSGSGAKVADFATAQGAPVAINYAYVTTTATGQVVGTFPDGTTLKVDEQFQQNLAQGVAPEEGHFYGIMGAGDFGNGVPGMLTQSGYIVEANGNANVPGSCGSACLIEGLTPALRAQFLSVVAWNGGAQGSFALSGAPSANQFDSVFTYVLSDGKHSSSATLPTLFDTGTPSILLIDNDLGMQANENALGHINQYGDEIPGLTLTATGATPGAKPASITTGDDSTGDYSNVVTVGPYGGFPDSAIYGISFFFHNAVMYDLANQATGYTPFYVTDSPINTGFTVTSAMGPLGLAGTIGGSGPFTVAAGGIANLSGSNTYTGATVIAHGGWLGLAGPGSIAASSGVQADGMLDLSRSAGAVQIQSLSGAGDVALGANTLVLANASGNFAGQLGDGGLGGGSGGSLVIASGNETLSGANSFTGQTGIATHAALNLQGSLAGTVLDAGALAGHGSIGGNLGVTGTVAPGDAVGSYGTLNVGGNYAQGAGSTYLAQVNPLQAGTSSLIAVKGSATLASGAQLDVLAQGGQLFSKGARYTLLSADQGLSGSYTLTGDTALSAVLGLSTAYDAQHVYLDVLQTRALTAAAATRNQYATLAAVQDLAPAGTLFTAMANLPSDARLRAGADQLSGDVHATAQNVFLDDSRYVREAITGRLNQGTQEDGTATGPAVQQQANGVAWWGQFVGSWTHADSDGNAAELSSTVGGLLLGGDMPMALGDNGRVGLAAGYTQTSFTADQRDANGSSHDGTLSAYAGTRFGAFGLSLGAAYTQHSVDSTRNIDLGDFSDHAQGHYKAYTSQLFGEAGYQFRFSATTLEPFLQAAYVRLNSDGFTEQGGAAALSAGGSTRNVTYTTLGTHMATSFPCNGDVLTAHASLGWRHAFGDVAASSQFAFAGGAAFAVDGLPIARNALAVDAGLDFPVGKNASFSMSYNGQLAHRTVDSGFRDNFIWRF